MAIVFAARTRPRKGTGHSDRHTILLMETPSRPNTPRPTYSALPFVDGRDAVIAASVTSTDYYNPQGSGLGLGLHVDIEEPIEEPLQVDSPLAIDHTFFENLSATQATQKEATPPPHSQRSLAVILARASAGVQHLSDLVTDDHSLPLALRLALCAEAHTNAKSSPTPQSENNASTTSTASSARVQRPSQQRSLDSVWADANPNPLHTPPWTASDLVVDSELWIAPHRRQVIRENAHRLMPIRPQSETRVGGDHEVISESPRSFRRESISNPTNDASTRALPMNNGEQPREAPANNQEEESEERNRKRTHREVDSSEEDEKDAHRNVRRRT